MNIYFDYGEVEIVRRVSTMQSDNSEAQTFIDVMDEGSPRALRVWGMD